LKGQVRNDLPHRKCDCFDVNSKQVHYKSIRLFYPNGKVQDTLVFSSLTFKSKKVILKEEDFINNVLVVNLEVFTNELSEVLILAKKQLNPIQGGTQKYVDMKFLMMRSHLLKSKHFNLINMENGTDFVRIYKDIIKVLRKENPKKTDFTKKQAFQRLLYLQLIILFFLTR
jgi:hypothetical protein